MNDVKIRLNDAQKYFFIPNEIKWLFTKTFLNVLFFSLTALTFKKSYGFQNSSNYFFLKCLKLSTITFFEASGYIQY